MSGFYACCFALLQRYNIKDLDPGFPAVFLCIFGYHYHYLYIYIHKTQIRGDIKFEPQLILIQVSVHSDSKPLMLSVLYVNQLETKTIFYFLSLNSNSPLSKCI